MGGIAARREMLGAVAAGMVALNAPQAALADWQGDAVKALNMYGKQVLMLEPAVESGDLEAIKQKYRKLELLSTAYRYEQDMASKVTGTVDNLIEACEKGDKATVKKEYGALLQLTNIKDILKERPVPKGARIVDVDSSVSGYTIQALSKD